MRGGVAMSLKRIRLIAVMGKFETESQSPVADLFLERYLND